MYQIRFVNTDPVIIFAASELKKYLRMMMPRCGEISVSYGKTNEKAFCLGLMKDFDMEVKVEDPRLDDVIVAKTTEIGGLIAGSNPRSVLLSVYRYLRELGCMWLFPGPDGESIPVLENLKPVDLYHTASYRYRGQCNEGAETQALMMEAIDFTPKVGLNSFMIEFDIPKYYYERSVVHKFDAYDTEAPLSAEDVLRWKRECEFEITQRGLLFHDMGHGWTAEPFGFDSSDGWVAKDHKDLSEEQIRHLAMVNGVREFHGGVALNTNVCMSNPETRLIIAKYIANYAKVQNNVDFLHVWLADASNNHCECDDCQKKVTSDWYVCLLNDIDEQLTLLGCDTHIVFIAYVDTLWAPKTELIHNTKRFTMLFAPITRKYTETYGVEADLSAMKPNVRNRLEMPKGMAENLAYLQDWKKTWKGDCFCYEYHFFLAQYRDLGVLYLARIIYDDIHSLRKNGLSGVIEDGSQASFFPNGFLFYVYSESLFDDSKSFETLTEEYFSHAYGEDWKQVVKYLNTIGEHADFGFINGERSLDSSIGNHYNPETVEKMKLLPEIAERFLSVIESHSKDSKRCRFVSWDLLKWHTKYVKLLSDGLCSIAVNDKKASLESFMTFFQAMAPLQYLRPTCYDHELCCQAIRRVLDPNKGYAALMNA